MILSENLKQLREKAGISQAGLATLSGVPVGTIRGIEQGRRPDPQWSTIQALAAALGITCQDLADVPEVTKKKLSGAWMRTTTIEKIAKASIELTKDALKERKRRLMKEGESPSVIAVTVLKNIEEEKKAAAEAKAAAAAAEAKAAAEGKAATPGGTKAEEQKQ
jgi:transcriptional regulator with XRE-family HTH domain